MSNKHQIECTKPVYKTQDGMWRVNDERALSFVFETKEQAELVLAMCPFVPTNNELMHLIKPTFRMMNIKSKWSK